MKTKNLFLAAAFTFISICSFANNDPANDPATRQKIRNEVASIIKSSDWKVNQDFVVTFYVNSKNEIIVNSTNNKDLDYKIKSVLNYKTITSSNPQANELFILPVRVINK
jgi:hypothetical protein